jgi:hypothetical protein
LLFSLSDFTIILSGPPGFYQPCFWQFNASILHEVIQGASMKKQTFFFAFMMSVCLSMIFAQDVDRGNLNTYDEEGSTGLSAPPPEQPAQNRAAVTSKRAPVVGSSEESVNPGVGEGIEDDHYLQADDYFISEEAFKDQAWIWVSLSKMVTAPSAATKKDAEFMKIRDGNKVWTKNYFKTVVVKKTDLKLGNVVIAFNDNNQNDIYCAPDSKDNSRGGSWFMGKIIDITDLYKGYVTLAGNYKVSPKNLRVIFR